MVIVHRRSVQTVRRPGRFPTPPSHSGSRIGVPDTAPPLRDDMLLPTELKALSAGEGQLRPAGSIWVRPILIPDQPPFNKFETCPLVPTPTARFFNPWMAWSRAYTGVLGPRCLYNMDTSWLCHSARAETRGARPCAIVSPHNMSCSSRWYTGRTLRRYPAMVNCNLCTPSAPGPREYFICPRGQDQCAFYHPALTDKIYPGSTTQRMRPGQVWFYDPAQQHANSFGKDQRRLTVALFRWRSKEVFAAPIPMAGRRARDAGEAGRWPGAVARSDPPRGATTSDWTWLRDESGRPEDAMTEPDEIRSCDHGHLRAALTRRRAGRWN